MEAKKSQEYELMLELERLESLHEIMDELGITNLAQVESGLIDTNPTLGAEMSDRYELLTEARDEMLILEVSDIREIDELISDLNQQLDEMDNLEDSTEQEDTHQS